MRFFVSAALILWGHLSFAVDSLDSSSPSELNQRVETLEKMMQQMLRKERAPLPGSSFEILRDTSQLRTQLGPAASKIYFQPASTWQVGLSSELFTYQQKEFDRANVLSVAPILAFRPHRRLIFNSQFLFENGGSERRNTVTLQKGQSIVQMAYLDWLASEKGEAGLRIGHQLVPVGWINTRQEPVTYLSVLKPELERDLIPATWHENGLSLWVDRPRADVQLGLFNSLDARGFRKDSFLAGGRSQGQNAAANDLMAVFRVNAKSEWFLLGMSFASGNTAQDDPALKNGAFRLAEVHARLRWARLELTGMGVMAQLDDAEAISVYNASTLGSEARGNSLQLGFNVLQGPKQLWLFGRQSRYNLHARVPPGFSADPTLDKTVTVVGASYFPLPNLVIKTDYAFKKNSAQNEDDEFSLGVGLVF